MARQQREYSDVPVTPVSVGSIRKKYPMFKPAPMGFKCYQCKNCMVGSYGAGSIGRIDLRYSKVGSKSETGYCKVQRCVVHTGWGCAAHDARKVRKRVIIHEPTECMNDEPAMYRGKRQLHNIEVCRIEKERERNKTIFSPFNDNGGDGDDDGDEY